LQAQGIQINHALGTRMGGRGCNVVRCQPGTGVPAPARRQWLATSETTRHRSQTPQVQVVRWRGPVANHQINLPCASCAPEVGRAADSGSLPAQRRLGLICATSCGKKKGSR
jgi:hypothetical protein